MVNDYRIVWIFEIENYFRIVKASQIFIGKTW